MHLYWQVGHCAHCAAPLDPTHPQLFCDEFCQQTASNVRYFRRCYRDGRAGDPEIHEALRVRMAHYLAGGYGARARRLPESVRHEVLAANGGRCCICNEAAAEEVDHIDGDSNERDNLQGLCRACHHAKTAERFVPITGDDQAIARRDQFLAWVSAEPPVMAAHDETAWDKSSPSLRAATKKWARSVLSTSPTGDD